MKVMCRSKTMSRSQAALILVLGLSAGVVCAEPIPALTPWLGLLPPAVAAGGADQGQVRLVLDRLVSEQDLQQQLAAARADAESAAQQLANLSSQREADPTNTAVLAEWIAARTHVRDCTQAVQAGSAALLAAALSVLPSSQAGRISTAIAAGAYHIPSEMRVLVRTDQEWKELETAVAEEQSDLETGQPIPEAVANLLAQVRADPSVVAARAALDANLTAIEAVFAEY
jgi:hypothetical protein